MSSFTQLFIHKNCYELFLSAHFNFYLILNLNLTFAVCRIREAYKLSITRISDANNLFFFKKNTFSLYTWNKTYHDRIVFNSNVIFFKHYICACIIQILSCFVFLVCRAFLTWASGSEDCANTSYDSTLNKLFWLYSILNKIKENESVKTKKRKHRTSSTRM